MDAKFIFFLFISLSGCVKYNIPIQTKDHPASVKTAVLDIELSAVLDIKEEDNKEVESNGASLYE